MEELKLGVGLARCSVVVREEQAHRDLDRVLRLCALEEIARQHAHQALRLTDGRPAGRDGRHGRRSVVRGRRLVGLEPHAALGRADGRRALRPLRRIARAIGRRRDRRTRCCERGDRRGRSSARPCGACDDTQSGSGVHAAVKCSARSINASL